MLDVIMTSSCRSTIIRTIGSFLKNVHYSGGYNFIINVDVLHENYLPTLMNYLKKMKINNVRINKDIAKFNRAFLKAVTYLYGQIKTPFYFHLEDDWIFLRKVNLDPLIDLMEKHPYIDNIRFSKEKIKEKAWMFHLSDVVSDEFLVPNKQVEIDGIPLVQTPTWSTNPSLARTAVVKEFINIPEDTRLESYICNNYPRIFKHQGTYIYGKIGDPRIVLDIGRNKIRNKLRKIKYTIKGGKYVDYQFGD
jgi:hypothetical protein